MITRTFIRFRRHAATAGVLLVSLFSVPPLFGADFRTGQPADRTLTPPVYRPGGVAVDPATQKVFVSDTGNNRILRFSSTAALLNSGAPEAVLGQKDLFANGPGTSAIALHAPAGLVVDPQGRLWVADSENHRVLRYDNASSLSTGAAASGLLGQVDFSAGTPAVAPGRLSGPGGVAVDFTGALWVADRLAHRVLRWDNAAALPPGAAASAVLGQASLSAGAQNGITASTFNYPLALALEHSGSTPVWLWVVDAGHYRVLGFENPGSKTNGAPADRVLGQTSFTSGVAPASPQKNTFTFPTAITVQGTSLWVADKGRVLRFGGPRHKPPGGDADALLGQADFTSEESGIELHWLNQPTGLAAAGPRLWIADFQAYRIVRHENAQTKSGAATPDGVLGLDLEKHSYFGGQAVAVDPVSGKLFVCDKMFHRVLRYSSTASLAQGAEPEAIFGQQDLTGREGGTLVYKFLYPSGITVDRLGNLWVADTGNHRVVRYANASTASTGAAATQVLGQVTYDHAVSGTTDRWINGPTAVATEYSVQPFVIRITRLWVADSGNNRVLRFDDPLNLPTYGAPASGVLGQAGFTAKAVALTANGMNAPSGLAVDGARLWVADQENRRVLRFENAGGKTNGAAADGVLFQSNFTTKNAPGAPSALATTGGRLFALCASEHRVLWFNNAAQKANGLPPDGALGQPDTTSIQPGTGAASLDNPAGLAVAPDGRLWVSDLHHLRRYTPEIQSIIFNYGLNAEKRFFLNILGHPGETYEIRSSTDLQNWNTVERTDTVPTSGLLLLNWTAPSPPGSAPRFYRLQGP